MHLKQAVQSRSVNLMFFQCETPLHLLVLLIGSHAILPQSPQQISVLSVTNTTVTLDWSSVSSAKAYRVLSWVGNVTTVLSDLYSAYEQQPPTTTTISNLVTFFHPAFTSYMNLELELRVLSIADYREVPRFICIIWHN